MVERMQKLLRDLISRSLHGTSDTQLRALIDELANQLCLAVDGKFDFIVKTVTHDPTVEKLQMLINFVPDAAYRNLALAEVKTHELAAKTQNLARGILSSSLQVSTPLCRCTEKTVKQPLLALTYSSNFFALGIR